MSTTQLATAFPPHAAARAAQPAAAGVGFVFMFWGLLFFEPEIFLANTIGGPWYRIPTLLLPVLIWIASQAGFDRTQYWPMSVFLIMHAIAAVFAGNRGFSMVLFKTLLPFYFVMCATVATFRTPEEITRLLKMFMWSFVWYALWGIPGGRVGWHPNLDNEDTFGPLMGVAFGLFYYVGLANRDRRQKWFAYGICLIGMIGIVVSFARGAVIAAGAIAAVIWLRSPQKVATAAGGIVALLIFAAASFLVSPDGGFWTEMASITEGASSGTGQARWIMWQMAIDVFTTSPVWGVGSGNFGVRASEIITIDWGRGMYTHPGQMYNQALHSVYFQILSEEGLIGCFLWGFMIFDFHRRILRLCSKSAAAVWVARGGVLDLRCIALGLEAAMIGFHVNGVFYNQIYVHWFWTLMTLALVLTRMTAPGADDVPAEVPSTANAGVTPEPSRAGA
jgi:O-antigen ligase